MGFCTPRRTINGFKKKKVHALASLALTRSHPSSRLPHRNPHGPRLAARPRHRCPSRPSPRSPPSSSPLTSPQAWLSTPHTFPTFAGWRRNSAPPRQPSTHVTHDARDASQVGLLRTIPSTEMQMAVFRNIQDTLRALLHPFDLGRLLLLYPFPCCRPSPRHHSLSPRAHCRTHRKPPLYLYFYLAPAREASNHRTFSFFSVCVLFVASRSLLPLRFPQPCRWSHKCPSRSASPCPVSASLKRLTWSPVVSHTHTLVRALSLLPVGGRAVNDRLTAANPPPLVLALSYVLAWAARIIPQHPRKQPYTPPRRTVRLHEATIRLRLRSYP